MCLANKEYSNWKNEKSEAILKYEDTEKVTVSEFKHMHKY